MLYLRAKMLNIKFSVYINIKFRSSPNGDRLFPAPSSGHRSVAMIVYFNVHLYKHFSAENYSHIRLGIPFMFCIEYRVQNVEVIQLEKAFVKRTVFKM